MNNRIALVIQAKNITPSQLADELGVQRSGVSHIMTNRNKPSLEFIQKLLKKYPDISTNWILFGEGPMMNPYPGQEAVQNIQAAAPVRPLASKPQMMELFPTDDTIESAEAKETEESLDENEFQHTENQLNDSENFVNITRQEKDKEKIESRTEVENVVSNTQSKIFSSETMKPKEVDTDLHKTKTPDMPERQDRSVMKIVIFYSDKTFVEYKPGAED
jgi:transcriptional regulator with XRE-family HTH domain